ncbi:hypothetical protein [Sediminibacterium sp.]|uniref:hypothetical protein n=1 Tax=Sediminibacterium sp. TaxID=1917865 RepID=UPI003F69B971
MSTSVIERPAVVCFTKNEIRYVFQSTDITAVGFYLQVELYVKELKPGSVFVPVKTFNLKPNSDGKTYLYINDRIDTKTSYVLPSVQYLTTNANLQAVQFYVLFREITALTPDPDFIETESAKVRTALKGGIEKQKFSRNNYFNYQSTNKLFFTWQPQNRFVFSNENLFLAMYITGANRKLKITIKKLNGSTVNNEQTVDFSAGIFWHLNISPGHLNISGLAGGDPIMYYEVSITDNAGSLLYNPYRLYLEYRPLYTYYDLGFHNSLGGFDTVRVKGDTTWSIDRDITEIEGALSLDAFDSSRKLGEVGHGYITKRDTYKGDIGFIRTADGSMKTPQEVMVELLISISIWQLLDTRWIQVIGVQRGVDLRKSSDKKFSFPIEWAIPFYNSVFTPKEINLGIGTETETY